MTTLPAAVLGVALLGYVSVGVGGRASVGVLVSLALLAVGLLRARRDSGQAVVVERIAARAVTLLPGALLVYLAFSSGGFFPGPPSLVAVLLGLILAARLVLAPSPPARRATAILIVVLGAYALWVLISGRWSHAPDRALTETDLALLYGIAFAGFATLVRGPHDVRWVMGGLALGSSVVCLGAFLSRAMPKLWPIPGNLDTPRISYPLTYWNALGIVAALGLIVCVGLTSDDRQSRLVKALSALPVPLLAVTLLLTFSRGAIAAGILGLAAFLLVGHPRSLLGAALALVPSAGVALVAAYHATSLARALDGSALQASQGRHVAAMVATCGLAAALARAVLASFDGLLVRHAARHPVSPGRARRNWAATIGVAAVASLALGLPGALAKQYDRFVQGNHGKGVAQLRDRLTDPGADGRLELWRVARSEFDGAPVEGTGAGTFVVVWNAGHPPFQRQILDAHSIYYENLGELGVVGFGLLVIFVLGSLAAIAWRIRGPDRAVYAAIFAVELAWTFHAGLDWDWEMPAVTLPVFVLSGAALAPRMSSAAGRRRPLLALAALIAIAVPALLSVSQSHLDAALAAFARGDCAAATGAADSSLTPLTFRPGPHEIRAYCLAARHQRGPALAEMNLAVRDDPRNSETHYGLAIVTAANGGDPRPAAAVALALNRYDPVNQELATQFRREGRAGWMTDAAIAPLPVAGQYGTTLAGLRTAAAPVRARRARPLHAR